jgi:hypothetical protein
LCRTLDSEQGSDKMKDDFVTHGYWW